MCIGKGAAGIDEPTVHYNLMLHFYLAFFILFVWVLQPTLSAVLVHSHQQNFWLQQAADFTT